MLKMTAISLLWGLVVTLAGYHLLYQSPGATAQFPAVAWDAASALVESGAGTVIEENLRLQLNETGSGIVVLQIPRVNSAGYPFLHLVFSSAADKLSLSILWRNSVTGEAVHAHDILANSESPLSLDTRVLDNWTGDITSLAVLVRGQPGDEVTFTNVSLLPASLPRQLQALYRDWTGFVPWQHRSINTHKGVSSVHSSVYPVPVAATILGLSLLAYALILLVLRRSVPFDRRVVISIFLTCWIGLDLLWQGKLWQQLGQTYETFYGRESAGKLAVGIDADLVEFISEVKQKLEPGDTRIFVGSSSDYLGMRGAYYLYPFNVFWTRNGPELPRGKYLHSGDYIVLLEPVKTSFDPLEKQLLTPKNKALSVEPILSRRMGSLYRVL